MLSQPIIALDDPWRPDVKDLLAERDDFFDRLYWELPRVPNGIDLADPDLLFFTLRWDGRLVGCGALVAGPDHGELKRVYVSANSRGFGFGRLIVEALEEEARRRGHRLLRLETGIRQPEALQLYTSLGWTRTGPFGRYEEDPLSIFMAKALTPPDDSAGERS